jgi:hypothetical protein
LLTSHDHSQAGRGACANRATNISTNATIAWLKRMLDSGKHDPVQRQGLLKLLAEQAAQGDRNGWVSRL